MTPSRKTLGARRISGEWLCPRIISMNRTQSDSGDLRKKLWLTLSVIPITYAIGLLFLLEAQDYMHPNPSVSHNLQSILKYWHSRSILQQDPVKPADFRFPPRRSSVSASGTNPNCVGKVHILVASTQPDIGSNGPSVQGGASAC